MFKLLDKPAFERRVEVRVPVLVEGENAFETQTFTAHFLAVDIAERAKEASDVEILKEVWIGWGRDVCDGAETPLAWTEDRRDRLLRLPYVRRALIDAYLAAMSGGAARQGN